MMQGEGSGHAGGPSEVVTSLQVVTAWEACTPYRWLAFHQKDCLTVGCEGRLSWSLVLTRP